VISPELRASFRPPPCACNRTPWLWFLFPVSLLFLAGVCHPQSPQPPTKSKAAQPYALICGTVWGEDDRPVYGVKVKIRREQDKKARWELYSTRRGEFTMRVPAAKHDYVVWADVKGLKSAAGKPLQAQEVTVHVEYDERVDTSLHLK